jgi:thiamine pyrophosphokinase
MGMGDWSMSSHADLSTASFLSYGDFDSSQEDCMRVVDQQHCVDKKIRKRQKKKNTTKVRQCKKQCGQQQRTSSNDETVVPVTCKCCKK